MLKKSPFSCLKRSPLKKTPFKKKKRAIDHEEVEKMRAFFMSVWKKRKHYCVVCGKGLGTEPRTYMFHHLIPKQRQWQYSIDITYDEKNIEIVCLDCHSTIEGGSETASIRMKKQELLKLYDEYRNI